MKLKYFLRGFGMGIIFAAFILTISYRISDKNEMTDGQIMKRAKELGMVMGESEELKKSLDDLKKSTKESKKSTEPSKSPKPTKESEKETTEPEKKTDTNSTDKDSENADKTEKDTVKFSIQQGMSSSQTANYLASIGLVDNGDKFDDYLCDNGYSDKIVVGDFEINNQPTYEQVAKTITRSE